MTAGERDTIAAVATPTGAGGVGIVRVSGPRAAAIAGGLLGRDGAGLPDRKLVHGVVRDRAGARVDDVLAVVMRGPRSFTGEDVAELHGHGGAVNMGRILRAVLDGGARQAEPGEFTRRAFENDKIDLTRAEAIADVIEAGSERAWRVAQAQLEGGLGAEVRALRERATELLAEVEACIDFPEEDNEYLADAEAGARAHEIGRQCAGLAETFGMGRALREGISVAIVGPVNAGKSSIFNYLVDSERSIVATEPGTTRDYVDARRVWKGVPMTFIDTAGEREAEGEIERRGIELGRRRAQHADVRVRLVEAGAETASAARTPGDDPGEIVAVSKGDLLGDASPRDRLVTSAVTGDGIEALLDAIVERVCGDGAEADEGAVVTSERQRRLLEAAAEAFARAAAAVKDTAPTEMIALELREATESLAEILGERVGEEVLDSLFARFCIGK